MTSSLLGVDGAPGGWLIAEYRPRDGGLSLSFHDALAPSIARMDNDVSVLAVDMPIGLSADGKRPVDSLVRQRLGPRRSTFFPTPLRAVLDHAEYADANALSKATAGVGLSKQAWNLIPKIREVDDLWRHELRDRLVETHPETCFAEMAGSPVLTKKSSEEGRRERMELLSTAFDRPVDELLATVPRKWLTDAIDALSLVWTARRVADGTAIILGGDLDAADRPMQLLI